MFNRVEKAVSIAAAVLLFLLMLVTLVDVAGRNLFNRPLLGATELTEVFLVSITFLLYPLVAYRERHIVVDLIDKWSNPVLATIQRWVTVLIGAGVFGIVAWRMWILGMRSVAYHDITPGLELPVGWVLVGVAVLSGVTALAFVGLLAKHETAERPLPTDEAAFAGELI